MELSLYKTHSLKYHSASDWGFSTSPLCKTTAVCSGCHIAEVLRGLCETSDVGMMVCVSRMNFKGTIVCSY